MIDFNDFHEFHIKQIKFFFTPFPNEPWSPQITTFNNSCQTCYMSVTPCPVSSQESELRVRLVIVLRELGKVTARSVGFTDRTNSEGDHFFLGRLPVGHLTLVPVPGCSWHNVRPVSPPTASCVKRLNKKKWTLTKQADVAVQQLFLLLDSNENGFLCRKEMGVLKKLLGYHKEVTLDEWADVLFGCDLEDVKRLEELDTEITEQWFVQFLLKMAAGDFAFQGSNNEKQTGAVEENEEPKEKMNRVLSNIFHRTGFDSQLRLKFASRNLVRVSTRRNSISPLTLSIKHQVPADRGLCSMTTLLGNRFRSRVGLEVSMLHTSDWFSITISNKGETAKDVVVDCSDSRSVLTVTSGLGAYVWRGVLMPGETQLALRFCAEGDGKGPNFHVTCSIMFENDKKVIKKMSLK